MKKLILIFFLLTNILIAEGSCKVGLLLPLSAEFANIGEECLMGVNTAKARYPDFDQTIKYSTGDSRAIGRDSVAEFKKLVNQDQVEAVQLIRSPVGMAVNPLSKTNQMPILGGVGHADFTQENPYAYRFWSTVKVEAGTLAQVAIKNQHKKMAIITTEDDWLLSFRDAFINEYQKHQGELTYNDTVTTDYTDYKTIITKIRASKPEAVFLNLGLTNLNTFIKRAREFGLTQKFYSVFWVKSEDIVSSLEDHYLDNIAFVEIDANQTKFYQKFKNLYPQVEPSAVVATCYSATEAIYQACKNSKNSSKSLAIEIAQLTEINTFDDKLIIKDREVQYSISPKEFVQGKLRNLPVNR